MSEYTFVSPPWLDDQSAETIHARMMANLPPDIDDTEGGFPWDFTKPTALEKAQMLEFEMMETIKIMYFQFAFGVYLDYHAAAAGLTRKKAEKAVGVITVTGSAGLEIPNGYQFAVPADGDTAAIIFQTTEDATIGTDGTVDIHIEAVESGTSGNVKSGAISIMASSGLKGIESIGNAEQTSGGTAVEDDEDLRQRIANVYSNKNASFVGCDADYNRWALEVSGVKSCIVVPEWDGPGTVELVVMMEDDDGNTAPATDNIVQAVYNHIVSPDDRSKRLAPIGATITVKKPVVINIDVAFTLTLESGASYTETVDAIKENISKYLIQAQEDGVVRRSHIGAAISSTDGVYDYEHLRVNDGKVNISVADNQFPALRNLTITEE